MTAEHATVESSYEGFTIAMRVESQTGADGTKRYQCVVTAAEPRDRPGRVAFERTLVLSHAEALLHNSWSPGTLPTPEQLNADLQRSGLAYARTLISAVLKGYRDLSASADLSVGEAQARTGMTATALRARER